MSDILQAMQRRTVSVVPAIDVTNLESARLFPSPDEDQRIELTKVATRLIEFKPAHRGLTITVAGNVQGEGASFVSYSIARILAMNLGRRVLWIDANFRSPQPQLKSVEDHTFAKLLCDPPAAWAKIPGGFLSVLAGGVELGNAKAELASSKCSEVFASLSEEYEFVIVDCPPVLEAVETAWIGRASDGLVMVVEARRLKSQIINHGLGALREHKVNVLGTVLNKRRFELPKAVYDRV